jgi:hypothetical protein
LHNDFNSIFQHITYREYLPKMLGRFMNERIGTYPGYDASVNPGVANEFVSAAFRIGHAMIQACSILTFIHV